jgi:hypothetical protein
MIVHKICFTWDSSQIYHGRYTSKMELLLGEKNQSVTQDFSMISLHWFIPNSNHDAI